MKISISLCVLQLVCVSMASGQHLTTRLGENRNQFPKVESLTFSPDSSELAICTTGRLIFLDVDSGDITMTLKRAPFSLAYSKDGSRIHTVEPNGFHWLDAKTKTDLNMRLVGEPGYIGLAVAEKNGKLVISELHAGGPAKSNGKIAVGDELIGIGTGENGRIASVIGVNQKKAVELMKGNAGEAIQLSIIPHGEIDDATHTIFRQKRKFENGQYEFYDLPKRELDDRVGVSFENGYHVFSHSKDARFVSRVQMKYIENHRGSDGISSDGAIYVFASKYENLPTDFKSIPSPKKKNNDDANPAAIVGKSTRDLLGMSDSAPDLGVEIFDISTGKQLATFPVDVRPLPTGGAYVHKLAFSHDKKQLIVTTNSSVGYYEIESGQIGKIFKLDPSWGVTSSACNDKYVAIGNMFGLVAVFDYESGEKIKEITTREKKSIERAEWSPDGNWLAFYSAGVLHSVHVSKFKE